MKNNSVVIPKNRNEIFRFLSFEDKEKIIFFFQCCLYFEYHKTNSDLLINCSKLENEFTEFKNLVYFSVFQSVVFDTTQMIGVKTVEEMTNEEIIKEIIFQLI